MSPKTVARFYFTVALIFALIAGLAEAFKAGKPAPVLYLLLGFVVAWGLQECRKAQNEGAES